MGHFIFSLNPTAFHIGNLSFGWYRMLFSFAMFLGGTFIARAFTKAGYSEKRIAVLTLYVVPGTTLGAKLGRYLFFNFEKNLEWSTIDVHLRARGLSSLGALIGILLALYLFNRKYRDVAYLKLADIFTIPCLLGAISIRLGNFINSEVYGPPSSLPWAVVFSRVDNLPRHPSMLYEALAYLLILCGLICIEWKGTWHRAPGQLFGMALILGFMSRLAVESLKVGNLASDIIGPFNLGQILSLILVVIGTYLFIGRNKIVNG